MYKESEYIQESECKKNWGEIQAEAALDATERMLEGNNSRKGLGEIKRWKSNRESSGDAKDK
jgi:hypothetical protein